MKSPRRYDSLQACPVGAFVKERADFYGLTEAEPKQAPIGAELSTVGSSDTAALTSTIVPLHGEKYVRGRFDGFMIVSEMNTHAADLRSPSQP
jgi:hypothetical protein